MGLGRIGDRVSCSRCSAADCANCEEILILVDVRAIANDVPWDYGWDNGSVDYRDRPASCLCFSLNGSAHWAKYYKE